MRTARALSRLDEVELGDHVCWRMEPAATTAQTQAYVAGGALQGDKVMVIGSRGQTTPRADRTAAAPVLLGLPDPADADKLMDAIRRETRAAVREGFRSVRVLAERDPVADPVDAEDLLALELKLDEFASESGAIVVCGYRPTQWTASTLEHVACVHPHEMGTRAPRPSFRMFSTGTDRWSVDGVVDSQCAEAFNAAVRAAVRGAPVVKLRFDTLDLIDAAGMHALVDAARHLPGGRVVVEGANDTVRLCWELAGYAHPAVPVVMAE
ncbi:MEDS domain-containing protein [Streptomyces vinaceus]|uniref:MEDS domain-containing protein n=1 Tax=Streptomyces vinaceus TaxID=1960 RepID=UPI0038208F7B